MRQSGSTTPLSRVPTFRLDLLSHKQSIKAIPRNGILHNLINHPRPHWQTIYAMLFNARHLTILSLFLGVTLALPVAEPVPGNQDWKRGNGGQDWRREGQAGEEIEVRREELGARGNKDWRSELDTRGNKDWRSELDARGNKDWRAELGTRGNKDWRSEFDTRGNKDWRSELNTRGGSKDWRSEHDTRGNKDWRSELETRGNKDWRSENDTRGNKDWRRTELDALD